MRINPFVNKKLVLLLSVLLYVGVFHIFYNGFWTSTSTRVSTRNRWRFFSLWNQEYLEEDDDDEYMLHVHIEDPILGHTGETRTETRGDLRYQKNVRQTIGSNSIAIGGGITSKGVGEINETNIPTKFQLFHTFLPTFCDTASAGFDYHFYFAYDSVDRIFKDSNFLFAFQKSFLNFTSGLCPNNFTVSIHMVECSHAGHPTWAQNDAMLEAYLDNIEFYYRINDDTKLISKNWSELFIDVLRQYTPPYVGVVGPNHSGGNTGILTYDFVHRTHVDIFGFYYPRLFTDWWGDDWVTKVYRPDRSTKLNHVRLAHTLGLGQRYGVNWGVGARLQRQLDIDMVILKRFINHTLSNDSIKVDGKKVISMSLYGRHPKYLWGAIRNAQLTPIFFPGWKLRFYVTSRSSKSPDVKLWLVPKRILNKLKQLGAELAYVKTKSIPPGLWRYLVVDDNGIDYFIVRNTHNRLSERDAIVVNDWLQNHTPNQDLNSLHCIRDHPDHVNRSIVDGLWGGYREAVGRKLGQDMASMLEKFHSGANSSSPDIDLIYRLSRSYRGDDNASFSLLRDIMWPLLSSVAYCHDSVSCDSWPNAHAFPVERQAVEYLGQYFDEHQEPIKHALDKELSTAPAKCTNATLSMTTASMTTTAAITTTAKVTSRPVATSQK